MLGRYGRILKVKKTYPIGRYIKRPGYTVACYMPPKGGADLSAPFGRPKEKEREPGAASPALVGTSTADHVPGAGNMITPRKGKICLSDILKLSAIRPGSRTPQIRRKAKIMFSRPIITPLLRSVSRYTLMRAGNTPKRTHGGDQRPKKWRFSPKTTAKRITKPMLPRKFAIGGYPT